jgi:hypothetical protein
MGKLADRAKMSLTSVATGSSEVGIGIFTLATNVTGFNTFALAGLNSTLAETISYVAEEGTKWEYGESLYTSTATTGTTTQTLARGPIYSSAGALTAESFTNAATVFVAALNEDLSPDFMMVNRKTVAFNYSLASDSNALAVGPVTVGTGFTVTIPTSSVWLVL